MRLLPAINAYKNEPNNLTHAATVVSALRTVLIDEVSVGDSEEACEEFILALAALERAAIHLRRAERAK